MENQMQVITLETMPVALSQIINEMSEIKKLLLDKSNLQPEAETWFSLKELCSYLPDKPTKQTVYGWVCNKIIPVHKTGKKLRFSKLEIDSWLKQGKKKTYAEIESEANTYLKNKGGAK